MAVVNAHVSSLSKLLKRHGQFLCLCGILKTFGFQIEINFIPKLRISVFISWHLHLGMLNNFCLKPPTIQLSSSTETRDVLASQLLPF